MAVLEFEAGSGMGKGHYLGGSTIVGPEEGDWFTWDEPKRRKARKGVAKAVAAGARFTEKCKEERAAWDHKGDKTLLVTKEDFEKQFGRATPTKGAKAKRKPKPSSR